MSLEKRIQTLLPLINDLNGKTINAKDVDKKSSSNLETKRTKTTKFNGRDRKIKEVMEH